MARPTARERAARQRLDNLKSALGNLEQLLKEIIENQDWLELGYSSFATYWNLELKGIPLATQVMKAHVIYALLETEDVDAVAISVPGVGHRTAARLKGEKDAGIPPELASKQNTYTVKKHERKKPTPPRTIRVEVTHEEWEKWSALSAAAGSTLNEQAEQAIRAHFERLGKRRGRRAA